MQCIHNANYSNQKYIFMYTSNTTTSNNGHVQRANNFTCSGSLVIISIHKCNVHYSHKCYQETYVECAHIILSGIIYDNFSMYYVGYLIPVLLGLLILHIVLIVVLRINFSCNRTFLIKNSDAFLVEHLIYIIHHLDSLGDLLFLALLSLFSGVCHSCCY